MPENNIPVQIDLNCDMGEGIGTDAAIMPFITSANIACGYHAGNADTMNKTVQLALQFGVNIGAHPSFPDRENFGRTEMNMTLPDIYELVKKQLIILDEIVKKYNTTLHHVKPHGALYNMAAKNSELSQAIVQAVKDFDCKLILVGLSGSFLISEAQKAGIKTASEVFADRTYRDDGMLTSRSETNALIENPEQAVQQVLQMVNEGAVTTTSGKKIPILAETVCIHGDSNNAVKIIKQIHIALKNENIKICSILQKSVTSNE